MGARTTALPRDAEDAATQRRKPAKSDIEVDDWSVKVEQQDLLEGDGLHVQSVRQYEKEQTHWLERVRDFETRFEALRNRSSRCSYICEMLRTHLTSAFVMLVAGFCTLVAYDTLASAAIVVSSKNEWFIPPVVVSLVYGVLTSLAAYNVRKPKVCVLFFLASLFWWVQVICVLRYPPDYGRVETNSVSAFYVTSPKGICRKCLFSSYNHMFNYTVVNSPQAETFEELAGANGIDGSQFKGEWKHKGILSFFLAMNGIFKSQAKSRKDWLLVYEDDAQFLPEFHSRINSYLDYSNKAEYDVLFLDTRCIYAELFLFHKKGEASVAVAYNTRRMEDFLRISNPDSEEIKEHLRNGQRGPFPHLVATMCNRGFFKCACAPFVREVPGIPTTLNGPQ